MRKQTIIAPGLAVLAGAVGFVLRRQGLRTGFDEAGLNIPSGASAALAVFSGVVVLAALVWGLRRKNQPFFEKTFPKSRWMILTGLLAAALILGGSLLDLRQSSGALASAAAILGLAGGACMMANDALRLAGGRPNGYAGLVPTVYLVCLLISNFRTWSIDPVISDYCYRLFALIGAMLGLFCLQGYTFDRGSRKAACISCAIGAYFCLLSLADENGPAQRLLFAGCALRLLVGLGCAASAPAEQQEG